MTGFAIVATYAAIICAAHAVHAWSRKAATR